MRAEHPLVELPHNLKLPYVAQGDPSGPPLLLLHGFAGSWRSFEPVLPHLPESIHALAVTQRGHGDAGRELTLEEPERLASDLVAFIEEDVGGL